MTYLRLERFVHTDEAACSWCRYPVAPFDAAYALQVGGTSLGLLFCSSRCAEIEARLRGRGALRAVYREAA